MAYSGAPPSPDPAGTSSVGYSSQHPYDRIFERLCKRSRKAWLTGVAAPRLPIADWFGDWVDPRVGLANLSERGCGWGLVIKPGKAVGKGELLFALRAVAASDSKAEVFSDLGLAPTGSDLAHAYPLSVFRTRQLCRLFDGTERGDVSCADEAMFLAPDASSSECSAREQHVFDIDRCAKILRFNAHACPRPKLVRDMRPGMPEYRALFPVVALMNHSCSANVTNIFLEDAVFVRATTSLEEGVELTTSYIQPFAHLAERQKGLAKYEMVCRCPRCQLEERVGNTKSAAAVKFNAEVQKLRWVIDGARNFGLGCTTKEMLPILRAAVEAVEVVAHEFLDDAAESAEGGSPHVDNYRHASNEWVHPKCDWASSRNNTMIFLTASVTLDAYAITAKLARMGNCWSEAATAYAHMCEIAEIVSPFNLDHITWAFGMLECTLNEDQRFSSFCVQQACLYAKHVVRIACGAGHETWNLFVRGAGFEDKDLHASDDQNGSDEEVAKVGGISSMPSGWTAPLCTVTGSGDCLKVSVCRLLGPPIVLAHIVAEVSSTRLFLQVVPGVPEVLKESPCTFCFPFAIDPARAAVSWCTQRQRLLVKIPN